MAKNIAVFKPGVRGEEGGGAKNIAFLKPFVQEWSDITFLPQRKAQVGWFL